MKLGVFSPLFSSYSLEDMLSRVQALGLDGVELAAGGYPGNDHCDAAVMLKDKGKRDNLLTSFESYGLMISALSCHGNPLHPDREQARYFHKVWRDTVRLAEKLGIDTVNCFSGCPGDSESSQYPNWVTCSWPDDFQEILLWQWQERVIPYWKEEAEFARNHGVQIAIEMHPGFVVYNTESLLRLRRESGLNLGCNFDPSHLFWQGADPSTVIRILAENEALFHIHAKDTGFNEEMLSVNGVIETKSAERTTERSWIFRTVGRGSSEETWRRVINALNDVSYDGFVSIEHEDRLMGKTEGLEEAVALLSRLLKEGQA